MDQLGRIIGQRYELTARLGEGGMGAVYRARDVTSGRSVALKLLQADIAQDPVQVSRFRRESAVLQEIEHPGLVRLLDASFEGDEPYLVFEVIEGKSLDTVLSGQPLALHQAIVYTVMLADAIAALHGHKIIHRDLKPSNVMVRPDGTLCLLDFGIAKHYGDAQRTLDRITTEGYVVGTPQYMPPEGLFGGDVLPAYDVWSLGVMFYEMVTGHRPFAEHEESVPALASALMAGRFTPASQVAPGLPRVVDACIERFLEARAHQRPANGAEARQALAELDGLTSGVRPRGGAPRTVQATEQAPNTARISRKSRIPGPVDPPTPLAKHVAARASGGVRVPVARAPDRRAAVLAAVAVVACLALAVVFKPGPVHPPASPSPTLAPTPTPSVESAASRLRKALGDLTKKRWPPDPEAWLERALRTPAGPGGTWLTTFLADQQLDLPLARLLDSSAVPGELLRSDEDRENWAKVSWLCLLDHLARSKKTKWPYKQHLAAQVDSAWPPIPSIGADEEGWKHIIFRALFKSPEEVRGNDDVRFGFGDAYTGFKAKSFTYRFALKSRPQTARVWFVAKELNPGFALLIKFKDVPPIEVWTPDGPGYRPAVRLHPEVMMGGGGGADEPGWFTPMAEDGKDRLRVYAGRAVPANWLRAGENTMEVSLISLYNPQHQEHGTNPLIWAKIVSYQE